MLYLCLNFPLFVNESLQSYPLYVYVLCLIPTQLVILCMHPSVTTSLFSYMLMSPDWLAHMACITPVICSYTQQHAMHMAVQCDMHETIYECSYMCVHAQ